MRCRLIKRVLPLASPLATANGPINERTVWALSIQDDGGRTGLGEAAPLPGFGSETPEACRDAFSKALKTMRAQMAHVQ